MEHTGRWLADQFDNGLTHPGFGALFAAAIKTDPNQKMSRQEKAVRWKKLPLFFKVSLLIPCIGPLLSEISGWLMPEFSTLFPFTALSACISCIVFATGMQKHRPPIPVHCAEALTLESAPDQYLDKLQSMIRLSYIAGLMMGGYLFPVLRTTKYCPSRTLKRSAH